MDLPAFCPEIPVSDLPAALAYYRDRLGLAVDWSDRELGLAGVSRGATRAFLSSAAYRDPLGNRPPVVLWLNLAGAAIDAPPAAKPYKLYEFFARDPDGNRLRIFYDFAWEERAAGSGAR